MSEKTVSYESLVACEERALAAEEEVYVLKEAVMMLRLAVGGLVQVANGLLQGAPPDLAEKVRKGCMKYAAGTNVITLKLDPREDPERYRELILKVMADVLKRSDNAIEVVEPSRRSSR